MQTRTIKFRVWHPKGGMSDPFTIDDIIEAACCKHYPKYPREYITMQYTGLKDKHGCELFENDIVSDEDGNTAPILWSKRRAQFYVDYDNDQDLEEIERWATKLGNIYENPELVDK